jgi:hypothetical protein
MLLFVVRAYEGDNRTYALQTVQVDIHGTTECTLLFEYPLDNTWTYEAAIEPLGKNHLTYALWPDVRCFSGPINSTLPPSYFAQLQHPQAARVFPKCFECAVSLCVGHLRVLERL